MATTDNDTTGIGSQADPWRTISHALSVVNPTAADPVTIHIATGTYRLSLTGEQYPLKLKSHVTLNGEADTLTILDASGSFQGVILCDGVTQVRIEGFTIKRGRPSGDPASPGGGVLVRNSSYVTITRNIINNNRSGNSFVALGGGVAVLNSQFVLVTKNRITDNTTGADGASGGGIGLLGDRGIISHNLISRNSVRALFGGYGGGIEVSGSNLIIMNNEISFNSAHSYGGGMLARGSPLIIRNTIDSNTAGDSISFSGWSGGGIFYGVSSFANIGGSDRNGNNIYGNNIINTDTSDLFGRQLGQYTSEHLIATYNYFGDGVDPHNPHEVSGNIDVDPYSATPVVFDTLDIVAVPSPVDFDTLTVNSSKSISVALYNIKNNLTDSIVIYSSQLNDSNTLLEMTSSIIRAIEIETLLVTIHPSMEGDYFDTLTLTTSVGLLTVPIHAVIEKSTDVHGDIGLQYPLKFELEQNYPNPFNPSTEIGYTIQSRQHVSLKIYDALGREITALVNEVQEPGLKSVRWEAEGMPSGVYFYRLQSGRFVDVKKMVVIR